MDFVCFSLQVNTSRSGLHQDYEAILEQLKKELRETKELHQQACDEIIHLQDQLQQSQASATEQHQLLSSEASSYTTTNYIPNNFHVFCTVMGIMYFHFTCIFSLIFLGPET